jgi:hypothetical protein
MSQWIVTETLISYKMTTSLVHVGDPRQVALILGDESPTENLQILKVYPMKNILHTEKLETFQTIDGLQITQALFR